MKYLIIRNEQIGENVLKVEDHLHEIVIDWLLDTGCECHKCDAAYWIEMLDAEISHYIGTPAGWKLFADKYNPNGKK